MSITLKSTTFRRAGKLDFLHTLVLGPKHKLEWYESDAPGCRKVLSKLLDDVDAILSYARTRAAQPKQAGRVARKRDRAKNAIRANKDLLGSPHALKRRVMKDLPDLSDRTYSRALASFLSEK